MLNLISDIYDLKKNLRAPEKKILSLQTKRFERQVKYVAYNIPYYKEYFEKNKLKTSDFTTLQDICKLPIINKDVVRSNATHFQNRSTKNNRSYASETSGSTGQKFTNYFDSRTWVRKKYLSKLRVRMYSNACPWRRIAILDPDPPDEQKDKNKKWFCRWPIKRIKYISLLEDPGEALKMLDNFKPSAIYGPPSFLFQLSERILKHRRSCDYVKNIFTSGEYLSKPMKEKIELGFKLRIIDIYGCNEFKEIAWECKYRNGYHINQDEVIVEILDENGRNVEKGVMGHIVVTDLFNKSMPLLRYNLMDYGLICTHRCPCGCSFRLMSPKGGRATDFLKFDEETMVSPYVFENAVELVEGIWQYQIIQESRDNLHVVVVSDKDPERITREVRNVIAPLVPEKFRISVSFEDEIDVEENGKFKLVKRNFD